LLASLAGAALAVPATAAEVKYDPGDKVYFTYCYAHPPAARIKPGDTVVTKTRDASKTCSRHQTRRSPRSLT
jgi:amidase